MGTSTTRYSHRMRCGVSRCRTRFRVKRDPASYARWPKCPSCGSRSTHSQEAIRARELAKQVRCECPAYPFPHRKGSLRFCHFHEAVVFGDEPSNDELFDYERCMNTPRNTRR